MMRIRYAQISAHRRRVLQKLEGFVSFPWSCPLHGLQFVGLCHTCGRLHREAHS